MTNRLCLRAGHHSCDMCLLDVDVVYLHVKKIDINEL
jgi:hypothetical protein